MGSRERASLGVEPWGERRRAADLEARHPLEPQAATDYDRLRLRAIEAQRKVLNRLRSNGTIGDEAFHRLEEEIDWEELAAAPAGRFPPLMT